MSKSNEPATKTFVKKTVEDAIGNLRQEMKENHNEVIDKLDSITSLIKKINERRSHP